MTDKTFVNDFLKHEIDGIDFQIRVFRQMYAAFEHREVAVEDVAGFVLSMSVAQSKIPTNFLVDIY